MKATCTRCDEESSFIHKNDIEFDEFPEYIGLCPGCEEDLIELDRTLDVVAVKLQKVKKKLADTQLRILILDTLRAGLEEEAGQLKSLHEKILDGDHDLAELLKKGV